MNIDEIIQMCDNALDFGDVEDAIDLLALLRAVLEQVGDYESSYSTDIIRKAEVFESILDIMADFK